MVRKLAPAFALAVVVAVASGSSSVAASEHVSTATELAVLDGECFYDCSDCAVSSFHEVVTGGDKDAGYVPHECRDNGVTCAFHECGVSKGPSLESIYRMVATEDLLALRAELPVESLRYVEERDALQVVADCGSIVAQLPLNRREAAVLGLN